MRPHVEIVCTEDLIFHEAALEASVGDARERRLSVDEETGAGTSQVRLGAGWTRPGGYHEADTEWYVLSGTVSIGNTDLGANGYFRAPAGLAVPVLSSSEGAEVLIFHEHGGTGFTVSGRDHIGFVRRSRSDISSIPGELTVVSADALDWGPTPWELVDGTASRSKILYWETPIDDERGTDRVTALWEAPAGWLDERFHHRTTFEEAYALSGELAYNFGTMRPGSYFHRPERIQSGLAAVQGERPVLWLVRLGATTTPLFTENSYVKTSGRAVNYDGTDPDESIMPAGFAVTSRTTDGWLSMHDRRQEGSGTAAPSSVLKKRFRSAQPVSQK